MDGAVAMCNAHDETEGTYERPGDRLDDNLRNAIRDEVQRSDVAIVLRRWMIGVLVAIVGQAAVTIWWAAGMDYTQRFLVATQQEIKETSYTKTEAARDGQLYLQLHEQLAERVNRNDRLLDSVRDHVTAMTQRRIEETSKGNQQ